MTAFAIPTKRDFFNVAVFSLSSDLPFKPYFLFLILDFLRFPLLLNLLNFSIASLELLKIVLCFFLIQILLNQQKNF